MAHRQPRPSAARLVIGLTLPLLLATLTGCTAAAFGKPSLALEVQSAVSTGSINVRLQGSTAILTGRTMTSYDALAAERAALRYEGVEKVINLIYVVR